LGGKRGPRNFSQTKNWGWYSRKGKKKTTVPYVLGKEKGWVFLGEKKVRLGWGGGRYSLKKYTLFRGPLATGRKKRNKGPRLNLKGEEEDSRGGAPGASVKGGGKKKSSVVGGKKRELLSRVFIANAFLNEEEN